MKIRLSNNIKSKSKKSANMKRQIFAILMITFGLLILLSIISHHVEDDIVIEQVPLGDYLLQPFSNSTQVSIQPIENFLGIIGSYVSGFLVNETVGYSSVVFPILLILWGWVLLRKISISKPLTFTNYAIVFALQMSAIFGIANLIFGNISIVWSGAVGAFVADTMSNLIGMLGSVIVLLTALFITFILAVNLDIQKSIERIGFSWKTLSKKLSLSRSKKTSVPNDEQEFMINLSDEEEKEKQEVFAESEQMEEQTLISEQIEIKRPYFSKESHDFPAPTVINDPEEIEYIFPSIELLDHLPIAETIEEEELKDNAELLRKKLALFGIDIESVSVTPGPVITLYELVPASSVKISRIVSLADDLALALAAKGIRIIAPIPGKSAVGVEIPNKRPSIVYLRSVLNSSKFRELKASLPIALGKTISGEVYTDDLVKMPHLLIAGSTGSGKSVGINTILASLLFRLHPSDVKFIIIDPKKIEMTPYAKLRNHFLAVSPDVDEEILTTPENAVSALKSVELEMEHRYDCLASAGVRNILDYNERLKAGRLKDTETIVHRKMPFLIVVIDELADLMITAAREVEEPIARLAQLARAVGIHLILATQRPSVDVITGVIKANFSARIAYQVSSKTDSRTILDMNGAEQLLGNGDMLYLPSGSPKPIRIQSAFISTDEIERITEHIVQQKGYSQPFQLPTILQRKIANGRGNVRERDEFFEEAARLVIRHQQGSVSLIQRRLKVGYSRAARIIDELESAGIVGPYDGSKARNVLIEDEKQLNELLEKIL